MNLAQSSIITTNIGTTPVAEVRLIKPVKVRFPKRKPSVVIIEKQKVYITADKTTCAECSCFPKDSPYMKPPKLRRCQVSPLTLYELAADVVDSLPLPEALQWSEDDVAKWMEEVVGLPQYKDSLIDNHINGFRLIWLENTWILQMINIRIHDHVKAIISQVRKLYSLDFIKFSRSIGLPPRKPLTHCTWFKSRTGPSWGIRQNWKRSDILRWMKIIGPAPVHRDHWDLVWYQKPDFPKTLFGRIPPAHEREKLPQYPPPVEPTTEYQVPRKFPITPTDEVHLIWMEHRPDSPDVAELFKDSEKDGSAIGPVRKTLMPKKIRLKGLTGKDLLLARRLMPKTKFLK
ncbi:unnamed protein product [Arctia plantaginis]|uniref:SAM domain-containing protein n=1 Tax=Arctia plantaginis TaxID=874455 RepID=A0A8S1BIM3_ARCPL|nr:unnamed protein product [Arctia plantaginis]